MGGWDETHARAADSDSIAVRVRRTLSVRLALDPEPLASAHPPIGQPAVQRGRVVRRPEEFLPGGGTVPAAQWRPCSGELDADAAMIAAGATELPARRCGGSGPSGSYRHSTRAIPVALADRMRYVEDPRQPALIADARSHDADFLGR